MMVLPSKEHREKRAIIRPWVLYDPKREKFYLNPEAPANIKAVYSEFRTENNLEEFWDA